MSRGRRPLAGRAGALALAALLLALGLAYAPRLTALIAQGAELLAALALLASAAAVWLRLGRRERRVSTAFASAAARDPLWRREAIEAQIAEFFPRFWEARTKRNLAAVADRITPHLRTTLEAQFARGDKLVGRHCRLDAVRLIGIHDRLDDRTDRFEALLECHTDIHRVGRLGELEEGFPGGAATQHQHWQFVRDGDTWRANSVKVAEPAVALSATSVIVE